jgi:acetoin utilization protein AcuB
MRSAKSRPALSRPIRDFMTPAPHTIGREQSLSVAQAHMRAFGVRHLPVLHAGKLVGILSQRDALFVETLHDVDPAEVPVEDAMSGDVYVVSPDASLFEVAAEMAEHKYGCAVVMDGGGVAGIFTTVDALRALLLFAPRASGRKIKEGGRPAPASRPDP